MIKKQTGFTLIELMITMVVFVLVIAAASQIFTGLLTQFKQQSKIAETNIEGIVGLEILRQDIEHAGYGLPWVIPAAAEGYNEAANSPGSTFNDCNGTAPCNPPRAILSGDNISFNDSDYLVIKAANVATNATAQKWTHLPFDNVPTTWTPSGENLLTGDRIIVISPGTTGTDLRSLVVSPGTSNWKPTYGSTSAFIPPVSYITYLIYGIDSDTDLRMPFNRADYYINRPATNMPSQCNDKTGILYKSTINHGDGGRNPLPLLDCAADMQVDFWLDTNSDSNIDWPPSDDISALDTATIRAQVKEVRVYIVAHEGQKDMGYDFSMNNTREFLSTTEKLGNNSRTIDFVNLKNLIGDPEYKYYRWKLYTLVVKPNNLR